MDENPNDRLFVGGNNGDLKVGRSGLGAKIRYKKIASIRKNQN